MRTPILFLLFLLMACGGDKPSPNTPPSTSSASSAEPTQDAATFRAVTDDPDVRQRLSPLHLLSYVPDELDGRKPSVQDGGLRDESTDGPRGVSSVLVSYLAYRNSLPTRIDVLVQDLVDDPWSRNVKRNQIETGMGIDGYSAEKVGESRQLDAGVARTYSIGETEPWLHVVLADRFAVTLNASGRGADVSTDDLWTLFSASGLEQLAGAPVYAEAPAPDVPDWAAESAARWSEENRLPPPDQATTASTDDAEPASQAPLSCDRLLPIADVERHCGVSNVRVVPTSFEREGENCNRVYKIGERTSGLVFMATRYGTTEPARRAVNLASEPSEWTVDHAQLPDLGSGGYREKSAGGSTPDRYEVSFYAENTLIEMNASDSPFDRPEQKLCLSLDQMEAIARGVADRLSN